MRRIGKTFSNSNITWTEKELKQYLKNNIVYNPKTGAIARTDGRPPFKDNDKGYAFCIWKAGEQKGCSTLVRASHIAWFLQTGELIDQSKKYNIVMMDNNHFNLKFDNLRKISGSLVNARRRKGSKKYTSQYKGVSWSREKQKWTVRIYYLKQTYNLGYHDNEEMAANIYNAYAIQLFGEFAVLNPCPAKEVSPIKILNKKLIK